MHSHFPAPPNKADEVRRLLREIIELPPDPCSDESMRLDAKVLKGLMRDMQSKARIAYGLCNGEGVRESVFRTNPMDGPNTQD